MKPTKKTCLNILLLGTILFIFSFSLLLTPRLVYAAQYESGWEIIPDECLHPKETTKDCSLDSFVQLFVNLAAIALKLLPYLAMLMVIWVGFNFIMAGGNPQKIQEAKKMLLSIFLGIIIIIILAWGWSAFVIVALTGETTGKIFQGIAIWEKEWWGGGDTLIEYPPGTGCCIIDGHGCQETTEEECQNYGDLFGVNDQFMGENYFCSQYINPCENYTIGCCVPNDPSDNQCYTPNETGCLNWENTTHQTSDCIHIAQCVL